MSLLEIGTLVISALALGISFYSLYKIHLQRGKVISSRPTKLFLFYPQDETERTGLQMTCFLYSTGSQGRVVEQLFVDLKAGENNRKFNVWFAGSSTSRNQIGGLTVPKNGVSLDNLFFTSVGSEKLKYEVGKLKVNLLARIVGMKEVQVLSSTNVELTVLQVEALEAGKLVCFEINSTGQGYTSYTDKVQDDVNVMGVSFIKNMNNFIQKVASDDTFSRNTEEVTIIDQTVSKSNKVNKKK